MRVRGDWIFLIGILTIVVISGCTGAPSATKPVKDFDVKATTCLEIPVMRERVAAHYYKVEGWAKDQLQVAIGAAETDRRACLERLGKAQEGMSCDAAWERVQQALQRASADVSNEQAYQDYQQAKQEWDDCFSGLRPDPSLPADEKACEETYKKRVEDVRAALRAVLLEAQKDFDADMATLKELEKTCTEYVGVTLGETVRAIPYSGTHITVDQLYTFTGPECGTKEHWHANSGSANGLNGQVFADPGGCGYGTTEAVRAVDVPVVQ